MEQGNDLSALLDFIRGEGLWHGYGRGIRVHPMYLEKRATYEACLELERRDLIRRKIDTHGYVLFVPTEDTD